MESARPQAPVKLIILLIFAAALSRLLPHPDNFSPVGAVALFGAAYINRRWLAVLVPLAAIWLSDLILDNFVYPQYSTKEIGDFSVFGSSWVYISFLMISVWGFVVLRRIQVGNILLGSLGASLLFFIVSNFGVWAGPENTWYPRTLAGLSTCYIAGIPYLWKTIAGDLFFSTVLFGGMAWLQRRKPATQKVSR